MVNGAGQIICPRERKLRNADGVLGRVVGLEVRHIRGKDAVVHHQCIILIQGRTHMGDTGAGNVDGVNNHAPRAGLPRWEEDTLHVINAVSSTPCH